MGRRWLAAATVLVALVALVGCGGSGSARLAPAVPAAATAAGHKTWTFMVYVDGANDLEQFGFLNINQMESVGSNANISIVVEFKAAHGFSGSATGAPDTRRYLIQRDNDNKNITSPVLQSLGNVDMASPAVMQDFIAWATANYPAEHLALVLWDHGAGWRSRSLPAGDSRGIIFDDSSNTYMTMADLNNGMTVENVHFDLTAIDASLMGMLEVCYEIRERTDFIAASEESPPGTGYPYDRILALLAANPSMTPTDLGEIIVAQYIAAYPSQSVTQSLIQTSRLADLAAKVDALGSALLPAQAAQPAQFDQARSTSQSYAFSYYHDLGDFAGNARALIPDASVSSAADAVITAIPGSNGGPVIAEGHNLSSVAGSHGLSIYLPAAGQYVGNYGNLRFSRDFPVWNQLLRQVSGQQKSAY